MLKNAIYLLFILISYTSVSGQERSVDFGIKGGVNLTFFKVIEAGFGVNPEAEVGYYGGIFMDILIDEEFSIQPEILYIGINDFTFLNAPIYAKYQVAQNLYILTGPSVNYFFDLFANKVKIGADIGSSYNITQALDIHLKFALGFQEISPNGLFLGLGVKL
ncbi:MAG: hypothetical protein H0X63_03315 [Flavobacteriales bacterium]|jgi:hypothetical protein|nr:hypothetical protein [Flavobacteriales bacterium]